MRGRELDGTGVNRSGATRITGAIRRANRAGRPAVAAFLTAGYPDPDSFFDVLSSVAAAADIIELGVPFSDPMADGLTIQRSSRLALERGVTLPWILEIADDHRSRREGVSERTTPILLMSYVNPLLAYGLPRLAEDAAAAGVAGMIVPDLPLEESGVLRAALDPWGVALVQLVTPATPRDRLERVCAASEGFVYAVTVKGTTGARVDAEGSADYLRRVRAATSLPVLAGFGVRTAADVASLGHHADGVVVGSAIVEAQEAGRDPGAFVRDLHTTPAPSSGEVPR